MNRRAFRNRLLGALLMGILVLGLLPAQAAASVRQVRTHRKTQSKALGKQRKSSHRSRARRVTRHRKRPTLPSGPSAERIGEIQQALSRAGFYSGEVTGRWDAETVEAMKRFQQAQGLEPTGRLDALSLQKLGLGSDVAGLAAPRPLNNPAPPAADRAGKGQGIQFNR
jgi:murein L,D-transpeptidase YcbB/YkuD